MEKRWSAPPAVQPRPDLRVVCPGSPAQCSPRSAPRRERLASPAASSCDRFIPNRGAFDMAVSQFELVRAADGENARLEYNASPAKEEYKRELASTLYRGAADANPLLSFASSPRGKPAPSAPNASLRVLYSLNRGALNTPKRNLRHIPHMAERILDAPDLIDDYYLNLLDWNAHDVLVIALGSAVYLWDNGSGSITKLLHEPAEAGVDVTSVAWRPGGQQLMVGNSRAGLELWDAAALKCVRTLEGHSARVGSLSWLSGSVCTSGARNGEIRHHDMRQPARAAAASRAHEGEVCGLKWSGSAAASGSGSRLASGGNDNALHIWDDRQLGAPARTLTRHTAAVKALAWAPWQRGLLASGGGTADRMIRFWDTSTGACLNSVDTHSQVCALQWSQHDRELVSSHGFSHNQLILWSYPSMVKLAQLSGHTSRALHLAQSPDGQTVASAGADETLRFWKIFSGARSGAGAARDLDLLNGMTDARGIR